MMNFGSTNEKVVKTSEGWEWRADFVREPWRFITAIKKTFVKPAQFAEFEVPYVFETPEEVDLFMRGLNEGYKVGHKIGTAEIKKLAIEYIEEL